MPDQTLYDNHQRPITYLRLAVTDRCNLRCFYCMPEQGIKYLPQREVLSYEEMLRLTDLLVGMGVRKVRITGGEPFVRKGLIGFLWKLSEIEALEEVNLTTNGVLTAPYITELAAMGVGSVNLSLDTLDRERFLQITRRDNFAQVMDCLHQLIDSGITTKINTVVMDGQNTDDIIPLVGLTREHPLSVRFIEEMPFNGEGSHYPTLAWTHKKIVAKLKAHYPDLQQLARKPHATSTDYSIPGYRGTIGIIAAFSRTFCGGCNRIRITAQGTLKTCLYDDGVLDLKRMMRQGASDQDLKGAFISAFGSRAKDGYEAEQRREAGRISESMSTIGG